MMKEVDGNLLIMGRIFSGKTIAAMDFATINVESGKRVVTFDKQKEFTKFTTKLNGINVSLENAELDLFGNKLVNITTDWKLIDFKEEEIHEKAIDLFLSLVRNQKTDVIIIDETQFVLLHGLKMQELFDEAKENNVVIVLVLQDILHLCMEQSIFTKYFHSILHFRSTRIPELHLERGEAVLFDTITKSNQKVVYNLSSEKRDLYLGS